MSTEENLEDCVLFANETIETIARAGGYAGMGGSFQLLSKYYRAMAIYDYLLTGNREGYFYGLIQSGLSRLEFLECPAHGSESADPYCRSSLIGPFFDAVAAGQYGLAAAIGSRSAKTWFSDYEYEDDFAYAGFLYGLVDFRTEDREWLTKILDRFEKALEGGMSTRLTICRALLEQDADAFDEAIDALLDEQFAEVEALALPALSSFESQEVDFEANRRIFIEGVALIALARTRGVQITTDRLMCPVVELPANYHFVPTSFPMRGLPTP